MDIGKNLLNFFFIRLHTQFDPALTITYACANPNRPKVSAKHLYEIVYAYTITTEANDCSGICMFVFPNRKNGPDNNAKSVILCCIVLHKYLSIFFAFRDILGLF